MDGDSRVWQEIIVYNCDLKYEARLRSNELQRSKAHLRSDELQRSKENMARNISPEARSTQMDALNRYLYYLVVQDLGSIEPFDSYEGEHQKLSLIITSLLGNNPQEIQRLTVLSKILISWYSNQESKLDD
jgi:hypothetical protein